MMNKYSILIVEDEALIAASLVHALSSLGYTVPEPVATGEDAIRAVKTRKPDLVLMDIKLAGAMDGIEAAEKIRAIADIPIVYLTAYTDNLRLAKAQLTEPYGFIVKPAHSRELHATIEMAMYKHALDRKLKESEEKYRMLVETLNEGIWVIDKETVTTFVNPKMAEILGYTVEEMTGRSLFSFMDDDGKRICERLIERRKQGIKEQHVFEFLKKDGTRIYTSLETSPIKGEGGEYLGAIAGVIDITERKRAEEALQKEHKRLYDVLETLPAMICLLTPDYHVAFANHSFREKFGESHGRHCYDYCFGKKEPCEFCESYTVLKTGKPHHWEVTSPDNSSIIDVYDFPFTDDDGSSLILEMDIDITERKQAEEALYKANKQLNLLSTVTRHDILNQLLALRGYLELSREYLGDNKTLSDFVEKEDKIAKIIDDQITFTRDYQELGAKAPEWQNVNEGIRNAMIALPMRTIHVEPDPADPEVYADPLFEKVFYNLIDNALRYGGDQMKTIRISSEESDTSLAIICEDDGVGIIEADKKRIFDKGFGKNTGLGLFLSREIMSITGITITETGEPGNGARFEITVPKGMWRTT